MSHAVKVYRQNLTICKKILVQKITTLKSRDSRPEGFLKSWLKSDCFLNFWFVTFFSPLHSFAESNDSSDQKIFQFWSCYRVKVLKKHFFWNWVFQRTLFFKKTNSLQSLMRCKFFDSKTDGWWKSLIKF